MQTRSKLATILLTTLFPFTAHASCGSAFCPTNTQWDTQGVWTEPGWRFDLRYEYIFQDQPRHNSDAISVGEISGHHDEVKTMNRNVVASVDYAFSKHWGVALTAPIVSREHDHIHNHHESGGVEHIPESWDFTELGDVKLAGRYQTATKTFSAVGLWFGVKLPTGAQDISNEDGDVAERSLQPGTGTTDVFMGPFVRFDLGGGSMFAQLLVQQALYESNDYEPGRSYSFDTGYRYPLTERVALLAQLNLRAKERDDGAEAEPEDSGAYSASVSPGVSFALTPTVQLYGFGHIPIYQHVNGVQLTEDWSVVSGVSFRF